ncbi:MAG: GTP 3',8-cyclase MoaA [Deltaproteobacteria bacterium]|nr:GTP 3',8-cyclase MoaA [Deltaproteobacteria bacterium]
MTLPLDADLRRPERNGALVGLERLSLGRARRAAPLPLVDKQARRVEYLRLSVTDRCNFRCLYCMPEEGLQFSPRAEVLSYEEIVRLVGVFVSLGINRVRITGGEPLLRRDLVELVRAIAATPGVEDLALSTNGYALETMARPLADAGLSRVNVSIDSLDPERFAAITRTGELPRVLAGIEAARAAGMAPVKLNVVVLRGKNDDELTGLVRFAAERGHLVRFIEYMPIGVDGFWSDESFVPVDAMLARLARDFDIAGGPERDPGVTGGGPARYAWLTPRHPEVGGGPPVRVGFITALSDNFCAACNRVRLTATGRLQECLAYAGSLSLRDAMRAGASDAELADQIAGALGTKGPGHRFDHGQRTPQSMSITGG